MPIRAASNSRKKKRNLSIHKTIQGIDYNTNSTIYYVEIINKTMKQDDRFDHTGFFISNLGTTTENNASDCPRTHQLLKKTFSHQNQSLTKLAKLL